MEIYKKDIRGKSKKENERKKNSEKTILERNRKFYKNERVRKEKKGEGGNGRKVKNREKKRK